MNWSLELLLILKNYELKFGITFNSQKLLFQNQFYTFLWGFLSSKIFIHISIHSLFNFIQKKIYAKIMAPEHIWYSIMNFQISIQKCFVINIYSLVLANTCVLSIFLLGYFALIFCEFCSNFFCELIVSYLFVEEEEEGPQWTARGRLRSGPQNEQ